MSDRKGKPTGQGYNFKGEKAQLMKARLRQLTEERERTGRISLFDPVKPEQVDAN